MKRLLMLAALLAVGAAVAVSAVRAAPIPGATRVSGTWSDPVYLYTAAAGSPSWDGLTSLGCPFVQRDYRDDASGTLTVMYNGWMGPIDRDTFQFRVLLRAHVTGTLQDVAGNTYTVSGNFTDSSTRQEFADFDLMFNGAGHVTLSGPAGVVVGQAVFRYVTAPDYFGLSFSSIKTCTIS